MSLVRLAHAFGSSWVTAATTSYLFQAPADLALKNLDFWFALCRTGATTPEYQRLTKFAQSNWVCSPLDLDLLHQEPLRSQTIRWLVRHRDGLTDADSQLIQLWAGHMKLEAVRTGISFSWKGRSLARVLAQARAYDEGIEGMGCGPGQTWPRRRLGLGVARRGSRGMVNPGAGQQWGTGRRRPLDAPLRRVL